MLTKEIKEQCIQRLKELHEELRQGEDTCEVLDKALGMLEEVYPDDDDVDDEGEALYQALDAVGFLDAYSIKSNMYKKMFGNFLDVHYFTRLFGNSNIVDATYFRIVDGTIVNLDREDGEVCLLSLIRELKK